MIENELCSEWLKNQDLSMFTSHRNQWNTVFFIDNAIFLNIEICSIKQLLA